MNLTKILFFFLIVNSFVFAQSIAKDKIKLNKISLWEIYDHKDVQLNNKSDWNIDGGKLINKSHISIPKWLYKKNGNVWFGSNIILKDSLANGSLHFVVESLDFRANYGLIFKYQDEANYCRLDLSRELSNLICLNNGKIEKIKLSDNLFYIPPRQKTSIDFVFKDNDFEIYTNGYSALSFNLPSPKNGRIGFFASGNAYSFIIKEIYFTNLRIKSRPPRIKVIKKPYVYWCTKNRTHIAWETNLHGNSSVVKYSTGKDKKIITTATDDLLHQAVLENLKPNQIYHYKCYTNGLFAGNGSFRADPGDKQPFSFGLIGDNRTYPDNFKKLNELMAKEKPDIVLNVGDVVESGLQSDWSWEFFAPNEVISKIAPYFISIGNHEKNSKFFSYYFPYPDTNNRRGHYYSFTYGNTAFLIFDDYHQTTEQFNWMEETLKSEIFKQADWRIVLSHQPAYSVGWSDYEGDVWKRSEKFQGLLKKYNVDFFFNGHTHSYERGLIDGTYHILSGGGGCGEEDWGRGWSDIQVFKITLQYCIFNVEKDRIEMFAKEIDGSLLDHLVVEKNKSGFFDTKPQFVGIPPKEISGAKITYEVSTPSLYPKMLRYKISYDKSVNTYTWTKPRLATDKVKLEIAPKVSGKYSVEIIAMDWDGRVTLPAIADVEYKF